MKAFVFVNFTAIEESLIMFYFCSQGPRRRNPGGQSSPGAALLPITAVSEGTYQKPPAGSGHSYGYVRILW